MITENTLVFQTKYQILTTVIFILAPFQKQAPTLAESKKYTYLKEIAQTQPLPPPSSHFPPNFFFK